VQRVRDGDPHRVDVLAGETLPELFEVIRRCAELLRHRLGLGTIGRDDRDEAGVVGGAGERRQDRSSHDLSGAQYCIADLLGHSRSPREVVFSK
jgi:hypothetical protein